MRKLLLALMLAGTAMAQSSPPCTNANKCQTPLSKQQIQQVLKEMSASTAETEFPDFKPQGATWADVQAQLARASGTVLFTGAGISQQVAQGLVNATRVSKVVVITTPVALKPNTTSGQLFSQMKKYGVKIYASRSHPGNGSLVLNQQVFSGDLLTGKGKVLRVMDNPGLAMQYTRNLPLILKQTTPF